MRSIATVFCLMTLGTACQTSSSNQGLPKPIKYQAIPSSKAMNKAYFRSSYQHLSDEQFSSKWTGSLESPLLFFRSYVNAWYAEVDALGIKEDVGPCFGDAHPENFGHIWFGDDEFRYYFNDLDDAGKCPVAYDALRYFTALRLYWSAPSLEAIVLKAYLSALSGQTVADENELSRYRPNLSELLKTVDDKYLEGNRIKLSPVVFAIPEGEKTKIFSAAKAALNVSSKNPINLTMLDVAQVVIKSGGSGGLKRYSILFRDEHGQKHLIEMKEMATAATEFGKWGTKPGFSRSSFMDLAWEKQIPRYFAFTRFQGKDFVVRSRVKRDPDLKELNSDEKLQLFTHQVQLIAKVHRMTLQDPKSHGQWLDREIDLMSKRYREAYQMAKAAAKH